MLIIMKGKKAQQYKKVLRNHLLGSQNHQLPRKTHQMLIQRIILNNLNRTKKMTPPLNKNDHYHAVNKSVNKILKN